MARRGRSHEDEWEELEISGSKSAGLAGVKKRLQQWVKENPNRGKGLAAGGLLFVLLIVLLSGWWLGWFGGNQATPPVAVAQPQGPPQTQTPPQMPAPAQAKPSQGPAEPPKSAEQKSQKQPKKDQPDKQQPPPLPEDVAKWKKADYSRARQQNDPKLLLAIAYVGEKTRGSEAAAQELTELLKPLPPEVPPASGQPAPKPGPTGPTPVATPPPAGPAQPSVPRPNQADLTKLVEAIIAALGDNGSGPARKTLEQIVSGTLSTDDDKAAVEAALKAMAAHPCEENDALLLRVLTSPEAVRPTNRQGPWPAKELQAKAFESIKTSVSSELRGNLADTLAERLMKFAPDNAIRELLLASDPLNCRAQRVLYERANPPREIKNRLEQQLAGYSAGALARLLKLPDEGQTGSGASPPAASGNPPAGGSPPSGGLIPPERELIPPERKTHPAGGVPAGSPDGAAEKANIDSAVRTAGILWSDKFRKVLEPQLGELRSLDRPELIMLAATIPQDSTRAALVKLLLKRAADYPGASLLESASFPDRMITDPGFLVLVKMLPRRSIKGATGQAPGAALQPPPPAGARGRPRTPGAAGKATDGLRPAQKRVLAEQEWMNFSQKLVAAWHKRFQAAALAQKKIEEQSGNPADQAAPKLPPDFTLNTGAKAVAGYHVLWPEQTPAGLSQQKPSLLEVYYVRATETNRPKKTMSFYARQAQTRFTDGRWLDKDKIAWFDGMRVVPQTDHRRSIDVLISRPKDQTLEPMRDDTEADMIVEILTIEIKDPANGK
jgi:hypothetical protein